MIAKQMDVRSNIKKYFDMAYDGETVIVPRKQGRNIVIISEDEYNRLTQAARLSAYANSVLPSNIIGRNTLELADNLKAHNLNKLDQIRAMKDNWNGNGAPAFPESLVDKVAHLINELVIQPELFPTALSTIQLEYDNSRKDHLEIELDGSESAEVFLQKKEAEEVHKTVPAVSYAINRLIEDFYELYF